jgi:hypothetical protein
MKVNILNIVYFISKGTVSFCLPKEYGEKEIKEVKKHHNFGEIEMCLSEKLKYNIKVKSRNCELFVLKKNDFLKLSVNFKDFIEKFLYKSLMIYLRFVNEMKRLMKLIEDANGMIKKKEEVEEKQQILEMIDEVNDQRAEENKNSQSDDSSKSSSLKSERMNNPNNNESKDMISNNTGSKVEELDPEKIKKLNTKFIKKVDKIMDFIEKYKDEFEGFNSQPTIQCLKRLKQETDLIERNELIDKIEMNLSEIIKN